MKAQTARMPGITNLLGPRLLAGLAGLAITTVAGCKDPSPAESQAAAPGRTPPQAAATRAVGVQLTPVVERPIVRHLRVTGQLEGLRDARVAADTTGKVREAAFERGAMVEAGAVLVRVDDRSATLALKEAEAALALANARLLLARSEVERHAPLLGSKAVAEADFRRMEADLAVREADALAATARRDLARKAVEDAVVRAPFAGIVAERLAEPGEMLKPDSVVARIVEVSRLRLVLNVPEASAGDVKEGQAVAFTVAALPGSNFHGTIRHVGAAVRKSARDLVVEADVDNRDGRLRPGYFADAKIASKETPGLVVPASAVHADGSRRSVFVVAADAAEERLVEVGESGEGWVEVRRGLSAQDKVVTGSDGPLSDGVPVRIGKP
jgi:RND family efflux transporter MFP subunit